MPRSTFSSTKALLLGSVVIGSISQVAVPKAQAQALQPALDVCTGISLNPSALNDVLRDVNGLVIEDLTELTDSVIDLSFLLAPLLDIDDVDTELDDITAALAAGDQIGLTVLDTNGNLIAPGDCNVTADGLTLNEEGGISIGGNQITGLGANGAAATAGEIDAIAFGNNASTAVGATGAVAIGTGASATAANSVALGAGSVADRGPLAGYVAPGVTGTVDSVGSVSVGAPGALRQITNVAAGTDATDATTLGQVQGLIAEAGVANPLAVEYDSGALGTVTLQGAGGTVVTNLADGVVAAGSTDAVNGGQLFATNQNVATVAGNVTVLGAQVTTNTGAIATNTADIAALEASAVQYDDASQTQVTLQGAGGTVLTNVAAGNVVPGSTDAVNGSQLAATNLAVAQNASAIAAINPLAGNAVFYDDTTLATVTLGGADGTTIANVAEGTLAADSSEAVNGAQLFATNQTVAGNGAAITNLDARVTVNEGDIAGLDTRVTVNEGDIANLDTRVTVNEGAISTNTTNIANVDARVTTLDTTVQQNVTQITQLNQRVDNVPVTYRSDADPSVASAVPTDTAGFTGASGGAVRVTNVAAGTLAAGSTDAVNGGQLAATNAQVALNRTDIDQNTADIVTINNNLQGSTVAAVQYSNPGTPTQSNGGTITNDVTFIGADAGAPIRVHNVAAGTLANDAVNVGQMQSGLAAVLADSRGYTDQQVGLLDDRIDGLSFDLRDARRDAFAGTAGALAVAGIPQTMEPGGSMVGGAVGHYRGQTAFAIGMSSSLGNEGRTVVKAGATIDTHGRGGFNAGAGFAF
jgi:autotransporter adhesin